MILTLIIYAPRTFWMDLSFARAHSCVARRDTPSFHVCHPHTGALIELAAVWIPKLSPLNIILSLKVWWLRILVWYLVWVCNLLCYISLFCYICWSEASTYKLSGRPNSSPRRCGGLFSLLFFLVIIFHHATRKDTVRCRKFEFRTKILKLRYRPGSLSDPPYCCFWIVKIRSHFKCMTFPIPLTVCVVHTNYSLTASPPRPGLLPAATGITTPQLWFFDACLQWELWMYLAYIE